MARARKTADPTFGDLLLSLAKATAWRAFGAALVVLAAAAAVSVATYSVSDPTWNTAIDRAPENMLGHFGASFADLSLQLLGAAGLIVAIGLGVLGLRLLWGGAPGRLRLSGWLRIAAAPVAIALLAGFAAAWPLPAYWPYRVGLGGVIGDAVRWGLIDGLHLIRLPFSGFFAAALSLLLGAPAAFFTLSGRVGDIARGAGAARALARRLSTQAGRAADWTQTRLAPRFAGGPDPAYEEAPREEPAPDTDYAAAPEEPQDEDKPLTARRIIRKDAPKKTVSKRERREAQPAFQLDPNKNYELPALSLLAKPQRNPHAQISDEALEQNARILEGVLQDFGVRGEIINVRPGPVVTLYELEPAAGVKSSRVIGLADDIARSMSAVAARVAVVPGRNVIGIELPNVDRETVYLRELLSSSEYEGAETDLTLALGKSIGGEAVLADLARMPHLLIAGTTGSGKSVGINTMILSLLYRMSPDKCKLILIDPKMLELSVYDGIPHLLAPVVTDPGKAVVALKWTVREMEDRYKRMSKVGVRNISGFNERVEEAIATGETLTRTVHTGYDQESGEPVYETEELEYEPMPFIVVVIDEMADLMMVAGKDIEGAVQRLAQMARAAGIHVIMATQRPSVDVITGTIKANFPTRISFQVTSKIDSRTILGEQGGEQLLGQGDMLFMAGGGRLRRVHGPFVSDNEVEKIVKHLKRQGAPDYVQDVTEFNDEEGGAIDGLIGGNTSSGDSLYDQAVAIVARDRKASTSYIQRRLQIGYNRAATLIERMEQEGVVSPANHAGKREIFVGEDPL